MGGVDDWFDQLDEKKVTDAPSQPQSRGRDYLWNSQSRSNMLIA